jgi:fluoroquinolone transport system permease protein
MTARLATLVRHDIRLQYRYGIYVAYAAVIVFWLIVLSWAGPLVPVYASALVIFADPAAVGFYFLGGLMMLERSDGVLAALAATPTSASDYFWAKAITLTGLALMASILVFLASHREGGEQPLLLVVTVALTSIQYLGIGVPIARRFRTVNGYLVGSAGFLLPVIAPSFLALVDPFPTWLSLIPATSQLRLMLVATGAVHADTGEIGLMLAVTAVAAAAAVWLALRSLKTEFRA